MIVSYTEQFDAAVMAEVVGELMKDEQKRKEMSNAAYEHSKTFAMDAVYKQWMELFEKIR